MSVLSISNPDSLFKQLILDYPNAYIKIGLEYIPTRTELFNIEHVRTIIKYHNNKSFYVSIYNGLPIIFTCDENERKAFYIFQEQLLSHNTPVFHDNDHDDQIKYLLILFRLCSPEEINLITKEIKFVDKIWIYLLSYEINLNLSFSYEQRILACAYIMRTYYSESKMLNESRTISIKCKYGSKCKSITDDNFICKFNHGKKSFIQNFAYNELLSEGFYRYGFIYLASENEYTKFIYNKFIRLIVEHNRNIFYYRVRTGDLYDIVVNHNYHFVTLKYNKPYDYETEIKRVIDSNNFCYCQKLGEQDIEIDSDFEKFYIVSIFNSST